MKKHKGWFATVLTALLLAAPALAQQETSLEEPAEKHEGRPSRWRFGLQYWIPKPSGTRFFPAAVGTTDLEMSYGTRARPRYEAAYTFGGNTGEFAISYFSHSDVSELDRFDPGNFAFFELQVPSTLAGINNDGLADAFESDSQTRTRDLRIDYRRLAFETDRARAMWSVGYRRVSHDREFSAAYHALSPGLPNVLPPVSGPRFDLIPMPDLAEFRSGYSGRGIDLGMDFLVPLGREGQFDVEAGLSLAILRGKTSSEFFAVYWAYLLDGETVLEPPYDEFTAPDPLSSGQGLINRITQGFETVGQNTKSVSTSSQVLEAYLGFRWRAWRGIAVSGGFRSIDYSNVGLNDVDVTGREASVNYEGYYLGVSYSY